MQLPIPGHPRRCQVWAPSRGVGLKLDQSLAGSPHKFCASIVLVNLEGGIVCRSKVLGFGWCPSPTSVSLAWYRGWLLQALNPVIRSPC